MQAAETFVRDAFGLDVSNFARRHGQFFLLRLPLEDEETSSGGRSFDTAIGELLVRGEEHVFTHQRAVTGWRVAPLVKRDGNPFPERISVGRARSCDVVLRMSYVSKLHAHVLFDPKGRLILRDQRSSNGTQVNGARLRAGVPVVVRSGDQITFGRFTTELLDANGLQRFLTKDN